VRQLNSGVRQHGYVGGNPFDPVFDQGVGWPVKVAVTRDQRLLFTFLLFVASAASFLVQGWILLLFVSSALAQNWTHFVEVFPSTALPPLEPDQYCFGDCTPDLPFVAGWIGIVSFMLGLSTLAYCWWMPKTHDLPQ
jgi:hypothetical protein